MADRVYATQILDEGDARGYPRETSTDVDVDYSTTLPSYNKDSSRQDSIYQNSSEYETPAATFQEE